jgi:hypothetical protein
MSVGQTFEEVLEVGEWLDAVEFRRRQQGGDDRPALRTAIGSGEQMVLAAERNLAVILPISGGMSSFIIVGIRCAGKARVAFRSSAAQQASSCTSS